MDAEAAHAALPEHLRIDDRCTIGRGVGPGQRDAHDKDARGIGAQQLYHPGSALEATPEPG
ncbi:hypothetical protein D3C81_2101510 [compost metagenome]